MRPTPVRRPAPVLLLLALLAALALLPARPGTGQDDPPLDEERIPTLIFEHTPALDLLEGAQARIDQGDQVTAVKLIGELLEYRPDAYDPGHGTLLVRDTDFVFRDARALARRMLEEQIDEAEFRRQFDGLARRRLQEALASFDLSALAAVADRFPLASCYEDALRAIADVAFDAGQFALAARTFGVLVAGHPEDRPTDQAAAIARWLFSARLAGNTAAVREARQLLTASYGSVPFRFGGREFTGATFSADAFAIDGLAGERVRSRRTPAPGVRVVTGHAELPPDYGQPLWSRSTPQPGGAESDALSATHMRRAPVAASNGTVLILPDADRVVGVDSLTGRELWRWPRVLTDRVQLDRYGLHGLLDTTRVHNRGGYNGDPADIPFPEGFDEVLVEGRTAVVQMIIPTREEVNVPGRGAMPVSGWLPVLAAYDTWDGRLRWLRGTWESDDFEVNGHLRVLRAPTSHHNRLLVPLASQAALFLACVDATDGRIVWMSYLHRNPSFTGGHGPGNPWGPRPDPPTPTVEGGERVLPVVVADEVAYVCSNVGGVAAVDAVTGELQWVCEYEPAWAENQASDSPPSGGLAAWNAAPAVVDGKLVFGARQTGVSRAGTVRIIDCASGELLTTVNGLHRWHGVVQIGGEVRIIIETSPGSLAALDLDGQRVWLARIAGTTGRCVLVDDVAVWPCGHQLRLVDLADGSVTDGPRIRPGVSAPLGDLTRTGAVLISRHPQVTQVFLDTVNARPLVDAIIDRRPDDAGGYLLKAVIGRLSGDVAEATEAIRAAASRTGDPDTGKTVLDLWMQLVDARAGNGQAVPSNELRELQAFASEYGNPVSAITLPIRIELLAGEPARAAAACLELLAEPRSRGIEMPDEERLVARNRLMAVSLGQWRQQGGEPFADALDAGLDRMTADAEGDPTGDRRARLLEMTADQPGTATRRLALARAGVREGLWALVHRQAVALLADGDTTYHVGAAAFLLRYALETGHTADAVRALGALAGAGASTSVDLGDSERTVGELRELAAAASSLQPGAAVLTRLADRPFGDGTAIEGLPVAVRGPRPAGVGGMRLTVTEEHNDRREFVVRLHLTRNGANQTVVLHRERLMPGGRPGQPIASFLTDGTCIVATGVGIVAIGPDGRTHWERNWFARGQSGVSSRMHDATAAIGGIVAAWPPMVVAGDTLMVVDLPDSRSSRVAWLGLDAATGEKRWEIEPGRGPSTSVESVFDRVPGSNALLFFEPSSSRLMVLDPRTGDLSVDLVFDQLAPSIAAGPDATIVAVHAPRRRRNAEPRELVCYERPLAGSPAVDELPVRWRAESGEPIAGVVVSDRFVITTAANHVAFRRLSDGELLFAYPVSELLAITPMGEHVAIASRNSELVEVAIIAPEPANVVARHVLRGQRHASYQTAACAMQVWHTPHGNRLLLAQVRAERPDGIMRNRPLAIEAAWINPTADGSRAIVPAGSLDLQAPAHSVLWEPGVELMVDGDALVIAADGANRALRVPLRTE